MTEAEDGLLSGRRQQSSRRQMAGPASPQDRLQAESSARSLASVDSNSPLLGQLMESTSLTRDELAEEFEGSLTAAALAAHTSQAGSIEQGIEPYEDAQHGSAAPPVLADIHTSSSHPLQTEAPSVNQQPAPQQQSRRHGSTRFALHGSDLGSGKASTLGSAKSRLGHSALKGISKGSTMSTSSSKSTKRVMLAAPHDSLEPELVSLEIQEAAAHDEEDQAWPPGSQQARSSRLMPSKSSLKTGGSRGRSRLSSTRFSSLRFSLEPQHHVIAVTPQESMSSDHSTISASFKSFRSIPSRLSQFGSQHSLRWTLAMDQSIEFWSYCKRRFITTAVVLAYFMYPDLSENIANIFSCYPVQFGTYSDGYTGSVCSLTLPLLPIGKDCIIFQNLCTHMDASAQHCV